MTTRLEWAKASPDAYAAMLGLEKALAKAGLERPLIELIYLRTSQINGCAYCVNMHANDARKAGETEQRLQALCVWQETPYFTPRERAALAWTEQLARLSQGGVAARPARRTARALRQQGDRRTDPGGLGHQRLEPLRRRHGHATGMRWTAMKANRSIACLLLAVLPTLASAHVAEKVETLHDQALAEIPGHRGLMLTVSFKPGQVSAPHVHPGSVFVYVLEGTVQTQLEGGPVETYTVGQSWYEPANVPHLLARNPDPMKPAKLLVWELLKEGDPILKPLERGAH